MENCDHMYIKKTVIQQNRPKYLHSFPFWNMFLLTYKNGSLYVEDMLRVAKLYLKAVCMYQHNQMKSAKVQID